MSVQSFAAALLAGGGSTRMGVDKCHLPWRGVPLWRHQLMTLEALRPAEILICCGRRSDFAAPGVRVIPDLVAGRGPIAGVAAALAASNHERILVLAVDLPEMRAGFLESMLDRATVDRGVVYERGGYYEALAAVYPKALAGSAAEAAAGADHSMQHFVRRGVAAGCIEVLEAAPQDEGLFRNLNTPDDL